MKKMLLIAVVVVVVALPAPVQARSGGLDTSFGIGGKSITSVPLGRETWQPLPSPALAKLPDGGSVVLAGNVLFALRPDGSLDRRFGGGQVQVAEPRDLSLELADVAVDTEGRVLVAGALQGDAFVARYLPDGTLDPSFAQGGILRSDLGMAPPSINRPPFQPQTSPPLTQVNGITLEPDGRIVLGGVHVNRISTCRGGVEYPYKEAFVSRLSENGDLDAGFGQAGVAVVPEASAIAPPTAVPGASQALYLLDRTIWGECDVYLRQRVMRMGANGALEGSLRVAELEFGEKWKVPAIALDRRGRILLVEWVATGARVLRLARGGFDRSFGKRGVAHLEVPDKHFVPSSIRVDHRGKIVVAGTIDPSYGKYPTYERREAKALLLARFTARGALDHRFGHGGKVVTRFGSRAGMSLPDLALGKEGSVLLATTIMRPSLPDGEGLALVRYLGR